MQSREEKQLDSALEAINIRIIELRSSISSLIFRLENEYQTISWPIVLDNFALISGQINTLSRFIKGDKMPQLKNYVPIPILLSPNVDFELEKLTEGRISSFNHEIVPICLRTKPEPEVEERLLQMHTKANATSQEAIQKQINMLNKLVNTIQDTLKTSREVLDTEANQKSASIQMSSAADTNVLLSLIYFGKGIKLNSTGLNVPAIQEQRTNTNNQQMSSNVGKAPSSIKTNIKSSVNPYNR